MSVNDNKEKGSLMLKAIGELPEDMLAQAEPERWKEQKRVRRRERRMVFGASMTGVVAAALLFVCVGMWSGEEGDKTGSAPEQEGMEQIADKQQEKVLSVTVYERDLCATEDSLVSGSKKNGLEKDKDSVHGQGDGLEITKQSLLNQVAKVITKAETAWEQKTATEIWDYRLLVKGEQGEKEYFYHVKKRILSWDGGSSKLSDKDGKILQKVLEK